MPFDEKIGSDMVRGAVEAGVGAALSGGTSLIPLIAGRVAGKIGEALTTTANQRLELWLEEIAAAAEFGDPDSVQNTIEENIDQRWARDTLLESFRQMLSALDEAAIPVIARLSASCLSNEVRPGSFERRLGALVCQLSNEDLRALAELTTSIAELDAVSDADFLELVLEWTQDSTRSFVLKVLMLDVRGPEVIHNNLPLASYTASNAHLHLFRLLKQYGFGREAIAGVHGRGGAAGVVVLEMLQARRLYEFVAVPLSRRDERQQRT